MLASFKKYNPTRPFEANSELIAMAVKFPRRLAKTNDLPDPEEIVAPDEVIPDNSDTPAAEGFLFKSKEEKIAAEVKDAKVLAERVKTAISQYQENAAKAEAEILKYSGALAEATKGKTLNKEKFAVKKGRKDAPILYQKDAHQGTLDGLKMVEVGKRIYGCPLCMGPDGFDTFQKAINSVYSSTSTFGVVRQKDGLFLRIKPMYMIDNRRMDFEVNGVFSKMGYTGDQDVKFLLSTTPQVVAALKAAIQLGNEFDRMADEYVKLVQENYTPDEDGRTKVAYARTQVAMAYTLYSDIVKATCYEFFDLYLEYGDHFATCYE